MDEKTISYSKNYKKKKRVKKHRLLKVFLSFLIIAFVVFIIAAVTVMFPIKDIKVQGKSIYSPDEIITASGIDKGDNIFLLGRNVNKRVTTKLPYIKSVDILRTLPDTVTLDVKLDVEQKCFYDGKMYYITDIDNKVLKTQTEKPKDLFCVYAGFNKGVKPGAKVVLKSKEQTEVMNSIINRYKNTKTLIDSISVTDTLNISFGIDRRFIVYLGDYSDTEKKLQHLDAMLEKIEPDDTGEINLKSWSTEKPEGYFTRKSIGDAPDTTPAEEKK